MKRILLASFAGASFAALALTSGSALAADLGNPVYKAPPVPAPVYSWTGCYVNGGVGYGLYDQKHQSIDIPVSTAPLSGVSNSAGEGWLGRLGGGCDYQFSLGNLGNFVVGALGDYDFSHIYGTFENTATSYGGEENMSSEWAVGGRIGYLVTPSVLAYFDGGYTQSHFAATNLGYLPVFPPGAPIAYFPATTYDGWFLGGGYEYAVSNVLPLPPGLFWRTEYRYSSYDYKNVQEYFLNGAPGTGDRMRNDVQTVTSSLVWRFNWK